MMIRIQLLAATVRILNTTARIAHCHPRIMLAMLVATVVALIGLAVAGAVSLVASPEPWKWFLFAAIAAAAFLIRK
jgi:hypothetical protein